MRKAEKGNKIFYITRAHKAKEKNHLGKYGY